MDNRYGIPYLGNVIAVAGGIGIPQQFTFLTGRDIFGIGKASISLQVQDSKKSQALLRRLSTQFDYAREV